jgi:hypothetical protein
MIVLWSPEPPTAEDAHLMGTVLDILAEQLSVLKDEPEP